MGPRGPIRGVIEGFLRGRYGYEGDRSFRVLALAVLFGATLVVGWLLMPTLTIPRFSSDGAVVRNGVAVVVACGKKRDFMAVDAVPEPATGTWWPVREGDCTTWYHRPPGLEQRQNRQERAASRAARGATPDNLAVSGEQLQTEFQKLPVVEKLSGEDFVQACGFKVPAEPLEFAEGMRKDCGIYGPSSAEGAQLEGPAW